ncbi:putative membrane protein [Micromonospora pisi]|uniref:Putative membrane protein n=1 Tax=Micromonospora pisi TaxID=589240 RepID=A0A495JPL5_9ACTN|nr:anthrone oxygenase family protein [Micromonospora pisi]RKR90575.1 putative membrane protein [Micromonospora pisi]
MSTTNTLVAVAAAVTVALTGAVGGVFLAYSNSVLPGLTGTDAQTAIRGMTSMNQKILNPVFLLTFVGTPIAAALTGVLLLVLGQRTAALLFLLASATYLLGAFLPTMLVNVPMNEALAAAGVPADPAEAARRWAEYASRWTGWNTLRAVASLVSLLLVGAGLLFWTLPDGQP